MASDDEIVSLGQRLREALVKGTVQAEKLTPKGTLLLELGRGRDVGGLSADERSLLGLEARPTFMEHFATAAKMPLITEGLPAAARAAWKTLTEQPGTGSKMLGRATAPPEPVLGGPPIDPSLLERAVALTNPTAWALGLGEDLMRLPSAIGAALAELGPEKAKPLTHALAANAPFLPWRAWRALPPAAPPAPPLFRASDMRGGALPSGPLLTGAVPSSPSVSGAGRGLALRPFEIVPEAPYVRALPPATEPRGSTGEAGAMVIGAPPRRPPPALPSEPPALPVRPPRPYREETPVLVTAEPAPKTTEILDAQGRPITEPLLEPTMTERERLRALERTPFSQPPATSPRPGEELPPVPEGPLPSAAEAAGARLRPSRPEEPPPTGGAPAGLPEPPGPVPGVPFTREAPKPARGPVVTRESVSTTNPDEVRALVQQEGGISRSDYEGIPLWARRRNGRALDEIAADVAKAQGRKAQHVEAEIARTLQRYGQRKTDARAVEAQRAAPTEYGDTPETWTADTPPSDIGPSLSPEEWRATPVGERQAVVAFFRDMMRGERSATPDYLRGLPPPIPLPGPEEEEEGLPAYAKRAAWVAGLSLPLAGMLFSRFRSRGGGRRPVQQKLGGELPEPGPQRGLFEPLPEVPSPPTAGLGGLRMAPVVFGGMQEGARGGSFELWTLTEDIPGHPKGSTLARQTLEAQGYRVPMPPGFEKTPLGDQAVMPGLPPREMPRMPLTAEVSQKDITETPLFGQTRAAREAELEAAQGGFFRLPPVPAEAPPTPVPPSAPAPVRWRQVSPRSGMLDAYRSEDGRFVVEQRTPDEWSAVDRQTRAQETFPTFHDARQWVTARVPGRGAMPEPPGPPPSDLFGERGSFLPGSRFFGGGEEPPSSRPPEVPTAYRTERVGRGPSATGGGTGGGGDVPGGIGAEPPTTPPAAVATAGAGGTQPVGAVTRAAEYLVLPAISVLERMGEAGRALSRTVQNKTSTEMRWLGQYAEPLIHEIKRLTAAEKDNLRAVMEEQAAPMNDRVEQVRHMAARVFGEQGVVPQGARERHMVVMGPDEQVHPFQALTDFFPHEFSPEFRREVLLPRSPRREAAISHLVNTGQAADRETAAVILDGRFAAHRTTIGGRIFILDPDRYVGGLERTRDVNLPDYIKDPVAAFTIRLNKVARRFAELDHYGELDAKIGSPGGYTDPMTGQQVPAHGLIGEIQRTQGYKRAQQAHALFVQSLGHRPDVSQAMQEAAHKVTNAEALMKLPLAAIANASQFALTALRTNLATAAHGIAASATGAGREAARNLGVLSDMALRQLYQDVGVAERTTGIAQRATDVVLTPFNVVEQWDRIVGANAGRAWGKVIERRLGQEGWAGWMRRELDRLNFSPEEMADIVQRRSLTPEERDRIAWAITDQTQYLGRAYRRSEVFNTPTGQILGQFKSFGINTGRLMKQMVFDEARHGNLRPLATFVALFPIVGEGVQDIKSLIRGSERPNSVAGRLLDNVFAVGGLGLATDFVQQLHYGMRGAASFVMGPAVNDAFQVLTRSFRAGEAALQGDIEKAEKGLKSLTEYGAQQVPFVGPRLAGELRTGPAAERRKELGPFGRLHLGLNPTIEDFQASEKINRQHTEMQRRVNELATQGKDAEAEALADRWNRAHPGAEMEPKARELPLPVPVPGGGEIDPRRLRRVRPPYRVPEMPEPDEQRRGRGARRLRLR